MTTQTPKLRFPEFSDKWEVKLLEDIAVRGSGHTPSKAFESYYDGNIPWVSLADSKRLDDGFIQNTTNTISKEGIKNSSAVLHPMGSVLLSRDAGIGKSAVMKVDMAVSQHFIVWRPIEGKLSNWFLYYKLQIHKPEFERIAIGSTIKTIGLPYFKTLSFNFPQLPEQTKIANFLIAIDEKIQALKQKKTLLEQYKKGIMQQIFSQELRFKNDDGADFDDWEEKSLGEICEFYRGSPISKSDLVKDGEFQCIHYGELFTKYNEVISTVISKTNKEKGFLSQKGDILMPSSDVTPKGLAKASSIQMKNVVLGGDMNILRPSKSYSSVYLSYLLNFNTNKIIEIVSGTTVKHIYNKDVRNLEFVISNSLIEQQKIANFLTAIDEKIEKVSQQISTTETYKKGLLQQMFI